MLFAGVFGAVEGKKNVRINGKTSLFSHFRFLCGNTQFSSLAVNFVGDGQFLATFGATRSEHATTVCSLHALTKTVFVVSLSVVRLECSFHCVYVVFLIIPSFCFGGLTHEAGAKLHNPF